MNKPDFSNYLVHFTKNKFVCNREAENPALQYDHIQARYRLRSILTERCIKSSWMPWTHSNAVCFTECVWASLPAHAEVYSSYGIGFKKETIFNKNGNPVFYIRPSLYNSGDRDVRKADAIHAFMTPFCPTYGGEQMVGNGKYIDYSHEREWRVASDLHFEYDDIAFLILKSSNDLEHMKVATEHVGLDRIIFMDTYKFIETLWPTHILPNS